MEEQDPGFEAFLDTYMGRKCICGLTRREHRRAPIYVPGLGASGRYTGEFVLVPADNSRGCRGFIDEVELRLAESDGQNCRGAA